MRLYAVSDHATEATVDVVVIGGGQAGLAAGCYLRRSGVSFVILDAEPAAGGAWQHAWDSLTLFSPARYSSLPGRMMPGDDAAMPSRDDVIAYLDEYERRYELPIERNVRVDRVQDADDGLLVLAGARRWHARAVISATGSWSAPHIPQLPGADRFAGLQLHSARYRTPAPFAGKRVAVVGGGNSGAQILAELSRHAEAVWMTERPPRFMADDVDGRVLFDAATAARNALRHGDRDAARGVGGLGDIVMIPSVKDARQRGVLVATSAPVALDRDGARRADGSREPLDAIVWCTGFRPATRHLADLEVLDADGRAPVEGTRCVEEPRLWMLGYGDWTGFASATLIGVGRSARATVAEIVASLSQERPIAR